MLAKRPLTSYPLYFEGKGTLRTSQKDLLGVWEARHDIWNGSMGGAHF